MKQQR